MLRRRLGAKICCCWCFANASSSISTVSKHILREKSFFSTITSSTKQEEKDNEQQQHIVNAIGQPTSATHPHLIESDEFLTPGILRAEYRSRRKALGDLLPENSLALMCSGVVSTYPGTHIPSPIAYRQCADFHYFSGVTQPHAAMALIKRSRSDPLEYVLFCRRKEERDEIWNGPRLHPEIAREHFEADSSSELEDLANTVRQLISDDRMRVFMDKKWFEKEHADVLEVLNGRSTQTLEIKAQTLRWKKSVSEIALLKKSATVNIRGILEAVRASRGLGGVSSTTKHGPITERDVVNAHEYVVKSLGADRLAFPTVMGASDRATVIHYHQNDRVIHPNDLCLMDAGCEMHGYVSDVT